MKTYWTRGRRFHRTDGDAGVETLVFEVVRRGKVNVFFRAPHFDPAGERRSLPWSVFFAALERRELEEVEAR